MHFDWTSSNRPGKWSSGMNWSGGRGHKGLGWLMWSVRVVCMGLRGLDEGEKK